MAREGKKERQSTRDESRVTEGNRGNRLKGLTRAETSTASRATATVGERQAFLLPESRASTEAAVLLACAGVQCKTRSNGF